LVSLAASVGVFSATVVVRAQSPAASADAGSAPRVAPHKGDAAPDEERLSDEAELARVVSLVEAAKYEECAARLARLLDPAGPRPLKQPEIVETARLYHATCLIGLGKPEAADEPLRTAVRQNPQMRAPDSLTFPPRVVDRFIKVREELYDELRKKEREAIERARREAQAKQKLENERWARMLALERMAREEVVVQQNRRWIGLVPFGVGQFQNGNQALGWVFFGSELALAATAVTSTAVYTHIQAQADQYVAEGRPPGADVKKRLDNWYTALSLSAYGFIGVAALGILEAQISFVPEVRRVRERPLVAPAPRKSTLRLQPDVAVSAHDFALGVRGAF
jgi:hypothetical protein